MTIQEQLKRFFSSAPPVKAKFDFVVPRLNSSTTVTPIQYYVDGDNLQGHEQALWSLCFQLVESVKSEYGIIIYAMKLALITPTP